MPASPPPVPDYSGIQSAYNARDYTALQNAIAEADLKDPYLSAFKATGDNWHNHKSWGTPIQPSQTANWEPVQKALTSLGWLTGTGGTDGTGGTGGTGGGGSGNTMFGQLSPIDLQFLGKYGVTPGSNQVPAGQTIFGMQGTTFNPAQATQRGIFG